MASKYTFSLAVTSQFYFCGLPLRLDVEPVCQFTCLYCYAKARGGAHRSHARTKRIADVESLRRRLAAVASGRCSSVVDAMLQEGIPVHFGGMADPFGPNRTTKRVALGLLEALAEHGHPTVVSTKAIASNVDAYTEVLVRGRFVVQFSFSTLDDELAHRIEVGTPSPSRRLEAMRILSRAGVPVTARLQPLLPGDESQATELIDIVSDHGARHVGVEHLKLPVEGTFNGIAQLSRYIGTDLHRLYAERGAVRVGREYLLPIGDRLPTILSLREHAHARGLQFGAADTDLLLLSDGGCCCSGTDLLGLGNYHRLTFVEAVRLSDPDCICYEALSGVWHPRGTLSRFVNSSSRLPTKNGRGAEMSDYLRHNWNGRANGPSPQMLWGVEPTEEFDSHDLRIYRLSDAARSLCPASASRRISDVQAAS